MSGDRQSVIVEPYNEAWVAAFEALRDELLGTLREFTILGIQHVGSTAVPGLASKPVIDVAVEVSELRVVDAGWVRAMAAIGFEYVPEFEEVIPLRRYFQRPAAPARLRCHAHVEVPHTEPWVHHVVFRDALRHDGSLRGRYAGLKRRLAAEHSEDIDAYLSGKHAFIRAAIAAEFERSAGR